jgi:hypothetical protein
VEHAAQICKPRSTVRGRTRSQKAVDKIGKTKGVAVGEGSSNVFW